MAGSIADLENEDEFSEAHEINVTPFIDVMLVLLIIFMVAAPLSTVDLPVDLPSSTATPQKKPDKPVYVTVKSDLSLALGETPVRRRDLAHELESMPGAGKDQRLFLRADRAVPYGELMAVLELLRQAGFLKVALVALEGVPDAANPDAASSPTAPALPQ
jgi:biopolymer transport protein ExbD